MNHPLALGLATLACLHPPAHADDMTYKLGVSRVQPNSRATDVVGSGAPPGLSLKVRPFNVLTLNIARRLNDRWAVEAALGVPPTADVQAVVRNPQLGPPTQALNGQTAARLTFIAPTVYLNRHFGAPDARWRPYVGLGLNYTKYKVKSTPVNDALNLGATLVTQSDSVALAAQAGVNYWVNDALFISASVSTMRLKTQLTSITTYDIASLTTLGLARSATVRAQPVFINVAVGSTF